jgi:hypothetical protein
MSIPAAVENNMRSIVGNHFGADEAIKRLRLGAAKCELRHIGGVMKT